MTNHGRSMQWTRLASGACLIAALAGPAGLPALLVADDKPPPAAEAPRDETGKPANKKEPNQILQPLSDLFRRKSKDKAGSPEKSNAAGSASRRTARTGIDGRAPSEKRADDLMHKALAATSQENWNDALEILQRIALLPEDSLYRIEGGKEGGRWVSVHDESQRLIGEAPAEALERYRREYAGLARQLLADANQSGDPADFGRLARSYFHTEAGYDAANRIGSLHLDRSEVALAAHWFAALWKARPALTQSPLWRAKAALTLAQAGQAELARTIFDVSGADAGAPVGAGSRSAARWLASSPQLSAPDEAPLTEWPMFFGTPRRTGVASGGQPLLLPRWRVSLTDRQPVQSQIEHLLEDLTDHGIHPLPLVFPTMVGGKIIVRTLHGVQVIDAQSGRPLWQTEEQQPLEKLIAASAIPFETAYDAGFFPRPMLRGGIRFANGGFSSGAVGENSPLCHLLFRNANFGLTSSDGQRLFVVDDPLFFTNRQPGNAMVWNNAGGAADADARLAAYDLETGRLLWEVGGPSNGEAFDSPLAGYFFFGAPVADGDDLFVIGESTSGDTNKQIRLVCLDPASGGVKWSQLVASADPDIEKDLCRRWWTAQPAVADGMVICPTTVGWTVAVDRLTHSLVWGYRAAVNARANANANNFGSEGEIANLTPLWQLKDAWGPAPAVAAAGRILCTFPESQNIVCLDQATGKELWSKPRGSAAYFAGVYDKLAVVVGREQVSGWRLDSGADAWPALKVPAPSGRGIVVADQFYLPVSSGEIWAIRLTSGEVAEKLSLPHGAAPAGNLAMYHGMLLSASATGLTAFEQREAVRHDIERRKKQDPRDPEALIREAQVLLLERDQAGALAVLRQVPRDRVPQAQRETFRGLLMRVLSSTIREDFSRSTTDADLADLEEVATTTAEKQNLRQLQAERSCARGQFERALDIYLSMADQPGAFLARDESPAVEVRSDLWAAGRIADLTSRPGEADRGAIDRRISGLQAEAASSEKALLRFATLFRNRPEAAVVHRNLAEAYAREGRFAAAERLLRRLARSGDAAVEAAAIERLARLMLEFKLPADAAALYLELERRYAEAPVADGQTGAVFVRALRNSGKFPEAPSNTIDWHADAIRVERHGVGGFSGTVAQELAAPGSDAPFFASHRLEVEPSSQRLEVVDGFTDELLWTVPLRSRNGQSDGAPAAARSAAHRLTVLHQGVLHALSPVDRQVLWTKAVEYRPVTPNVFGRNLNSLSALQSPANLANRQAGLHAQAALPATLSLATDEIVASLGRRQLTVFDAQSGEIAWTCSGLRAGTIVLGGNEVIYLRPADGQNPLALRAVDGSPVETKHLADSLSRCIHMIGDQFVLQGLSGGKPGLHLFDPVTNRDQWTLPLQPQSRISILDNDRAAVLDLEGGKFGLIDLTTGRRRELATIPADELTQRTDAFAVADQSGLYLLLNKGPPSSSSSDQVPFIRASGTILAFDLESGKQRWKQTVQHQNLLLERLTASPYLLFSHREYKTKGRLPVWSLHLVAINKLTGVKLLDDKSISQPGFRSITVSAADRYVELRSYSERLRLYPADKPASAGQSGGD